MRKLAGKTLRASLAPGPQEKPPREKSQDVVPSSSSFCIFSSFDAIFPELGLSRSFGKDLHPSTFAGLEPVRLDIKTSHPMFIIYPNRTCVMIQRDIQKYSKNPERFENHCIVLGESGFCSGEHYWEIETKDAADWVIGVAAESIERKVRVPPQAIRDKVWAIQLPVVKDINPKGGTSGQRFGVYLDYDKDQVSFYDAKKCHLYTCRAQFKEKVYPFFWNTTREKSVSLTICHQRDM